MKDLIIKKVTSQTEIEELQKMEYNVSIYFKKYAKKQGIKDHQIENYTMENTKKYLNKQYQKFIAKIKNICVGMIILKKKKSTYDKQTIYEIIDLYVIEDYRHKNIGKSLIAFAKNKFNCRLELSCFYDAPANKFYKHLGAKLLECVYTI